MGARHANDPGWIVGVCGDIHVRAATVSGPVEAAVRHIGKYKCARPLEVPEVRRGMDAGSGLAAMVFGNRGLASVFPVK